jgi:hypothetical protein
MVAGQPCLQAAGAAGRHEGSTDTTSPISVGGGNAKPAPSRQRVNGNRHGEAKALASQAVKPGGAAGAAPTLTSHGTSCRAAAVCALGGRRQGATRITKCMTEANGHSMPCVPKEVKQGARGRRGNLGSHSTSACTQPAWPAAAQRPPAAHSPHPRWHPRTLCCVTTGARGARPWSARAAARRGGGGAVRWCWRHRRGTD